MPENKTKDTQPFWLRQTSITIVGVLLLTLVGSTLYDLLVRPGLTSFGRLILDVVTFGSTTLRDAAYSSAALDPTPVTAILLLQVVLVFAVLPGLIVVSRAMEARRDKAIEKKFDEAPDGEVKTLLESELERSRGIERRMTILFWVIFIPWFAAILVGGTVHNQSVLIWRVFHADIAILTPYIAPNEKAQMIAQFAAMETGNDYQVIRDRMDALAKDLGVKIKNIETW